MGGRWKRCGLCGIPHPDFGEGVIAVMVKTGADLDEPRGLAKLETRRAKYKLPKRVMFVANLTRNAMGKVLKSNPREAYWDLFAKHASGRSRRAELSTGVRKKEGDFSDPYCYTKGLEGGRIQPALREASGGVVS